MNTNTKNKAVKSAVIGAVAALAMGPTLLVTAGPAQAAQSDLNVTVNGNAVNFSGQGPVERGGRVLVPLRGVLEQLGAYVSYDSSRQIVTAVRNQTRIVLPIGGTTARIDGNPVSLDTPAEIVNGSTLVPLRFVAESLGAQVGFESDTRTVAIRSAGGRGTAGSSARPPIPDDLNRRGEIVQGTISALDADGRTLTLRGPGGRREYTFAANYRIERRLPGGDRNTARWSDLSNGDWVELALNANNRVRTITLLAPGNGAPGSNRRVGGVIRELTGLRGNVYTIEFENGSRVDVASDAPVRYRGRAAGRDLLRVGDRVTVRTDPDSGIGRGIEIADRNP